MLPVFLAAAVAAAAPAADSTGPAPDPVLEWAERDLRTTRKAEAALVAAAAGPAIYLVGNFAITTFATEDGGLNAGTTTGRGLVGLGMVGVVAAPPLLFYHARRGRGALEKQGLDVGRAGLAGGVFLWAVSFGVLTSSADAIVAGEADDVRGPLIVATAAYVGSLAIGAAQLRANHRARRGAGWLGLHPWHREQATGIALAGVLP